MFEKVKSWAGDRLDQAHELMGWAVFCVASTLVCMGRIDGPTYALMIGGAVVTVVGVERFRGLRVGPAGLEVNRDDADRR